MTWQFSRVGKPAAVAADIATTAAQITLQPPEEGIKDAVANLLAVVLAALPSTAAVRVEVGRQQVPGAPGQTTNSLYVRVETIYNFLE